MAVEVVVHRRRRRVVAHIDHRLGPALPARRRRRAGVGIDQHLAGTRRKSPGAHNQFDGAVAVEIAQRRRRERPFPHAVKIAGICLPGDAVGAPEQCQAAVLAAGDEVGPGVAVHVGARQLQERQDREAAWIERDGGAIVPDRCPVRHPRRSGERRSLPGIVARRLSDSVSGGITRISGYGQSSHQPNEADSAERPSQGHEKS